MRKLFYILALLLLLWVAGFFLFVALLPRTAPNADAKADAKADAIVVLTGSNGRVEHGFKALAAGAAPVLFISGVGKDVTLAEMIAAHTDEQTRAKLAALRPRMVLDHRANSTETNAEETARFVAKYHIRSIRLVTAHYHMPRSVLEFRDAMPGVTILADPVLPAESGGKPWWRDSAARRIMLSEFAKTIGAWLRQWVL